MNRLYGNTIKTTVKFFVIALFIIALFQITKNVKSATAETTCNKFICTSVKIGEQDSLWSIAEKYYTSDYKDIDTYIEEIKHTNNLKGDTIHTGNYLVVPHYSK